MVHRKCSVFWNSISMPIGLVSSVQFSLSVMSNSLQPHELQHTRPPYPSPTPQVYSNSCPSSRWSIQPSHPLSSPSPPAPNPSQHQSLFQWVNSLHEVAKVLEFQAITKKIPQIQLNWHRKLLKPAKWEQEVIYYVQHKLVYLKINA